METDNGNQESHCPGGCPFMALGPKFWQSLHKPPFRKRHPLIFWAGLILGVIILANLVSSFFEDNEAALSEPSLALVQVEGPIIDSSTTVGWIDKLLASPQIKGILVRVNSPGGGAAASQEIYMALKRAASKIPVCVSMGPTAASGGLMVSMAGQRIFAGPSTLTGSIGVRMDVPQFQELMGKIGIGQETLVSGPYKNTPSYTHAMTPADKEYLQGLVENMYSQFVNIVAQNRKMAPEKVAPIANGKIYTGEQALALGLVDELGSQYEAHAWLAKTANVPQERKLVLKPDKKQRLMDLVIDHAKGAIQECLSSIFAQNMLPIFSYSW